MSLGELTEHACQWLRAGGPHGDVVVSSRVRLARNVAGFPFLSRASAEQRRDVLNLAEKRIADSGLARQMFWIDLSQSPRLDRQLLVERHLISRQHSHGSDPRGVAISTNEDWAIMVNEEDHLRIQVLRSGLQLDEAYTHANNIDDRLEAKMPFAYAGRLGYLTACPTNVGTGIRVSVMLHLPALKMTGEIDKMQRAAKDMHLAVRGFHGEGTEAVGEFHQISNQTTLGRTERDILSDFQDQIIPRIIEYEVKARRALADRRAVILDDKVQRAWAILTHARLLGTEETMHMLSHLRLGVSMGRLPGVDIRTINELFLMVQSAHLQRVAGHALDGAERREFRASYVRRRLNV